MRYRDFYGAAISATVTGGLFGFPLFAAMLGVGAPSMEAVQTPDRWASYEYSIRADELARMMGAVEAPTEQPEEPVEAQPQAVDEVVADVVEPTPAATPEPMMTRDDAPAPTEVVAEVAPSPEPQVAVEGAPEPVKSKKSKGKKGSCGEIENPGIYKSRSDAYTVSRDVVDYYTASMARFNSLGWSKPYRGEDDKGWVIGGFGCKSPLHLGGLRRNDVVQRVNGKKTNTMLQVLGIYLGQRKRADFKVEILRNGKPMTLSYTLV